MAHRILLLDASPPVVAALRLHYVEFFGKFYKTGGKEFRPFKLSDAPG